MIWISRNDESFKTNHVVIPTLAGAIVFTVVLLAVYGVEYALRFVTGSTPSGSRRTLRGLNTKNLKARLTESAPSGWQNLVIVHDTLEVRNFADEVRQLLEESGWQIDQTGFWPGPDVQDVEIGLPVEGNAGLEALGKFLNDHGYKAAVQPSSGGSSTARITIGEASE
jgi:hypothetical protein